MNSNDPKAINVSIGDEFGNMVETFDWTTSDILTVQDHAIEAAYCGAEKKVMLHKLRGDYAVAAG